MLEISIIKNTKMKCRKCGCDIDARLKLSKEKHLCKKCGKKTIKKTIKKTTKPRTKKIQRGG